jgi:hypothetical protein
MPDMPIAAFFVLSLVVLWLGILFGSWAQQIRKALIESESNVINVIEGALLTLFGLLIGFTFSMAVNRYDARKLLAVQEANAIGTTWLRTALMPDPVRTQEQSLLREYVQERLLYHTEFRAREESHYNELHAQTLRKKLWAVASDYAVDHRESVTGLYLQALNSTIDIAGERVAADENRIPAAAWWMLLFVGFVACAVMGTKINPRMVLLQSILPIVLASTLTMTMDLDSPRFGFIRVTQTEMQRVGQDMGLTQQAP